MRKWLYHFLFTCMFLLKVFQSLLVEQYRYQIVSERWQSSSLKAAQVLHFELNPVATSVLIHSCEWLYRTCFVHLCMRVRIEVTKKKHKIWSSRSDHTEMTALFEQGCTRGRHSNEKPQQPLLPEVSSDKGKIKHTNGQEIIYQGPKSAEKLQKERPRWGNHIQLLFISRFLWFSHLHTLTEMCLFAYSCYSLACSCFCICIDSRRSGRGHMCSWNK